MAYLDFFTRSVKSEVEMHLEETQLEVIQAKIKTKTLKECLSFKVSEEKANPLNSKLAGAYPNPKDMPAVTNDNGDKLTLLVQINGSELPLNILKDGMLQIFINTNDDLYGLDYDNPCKQNNFKVRYLSKEALNDYDLIEVASNHYEVVPQERKIEACIVKQAITTYDYRYNSIIKECGGVSFNSLDFDNQAYFKDENETYNIQMLGYPFFNNYDCRLEKFEDYDILLFQLDSFKDISWGDMGVGNFFIKASDLANLDFSNVLFNWDGY